MMGTKARTFAPVPPVSLEDLVPPDHFYRHLERSLDLGFVRELVRDAYAGIGRPSVDPVVFFKLHLILFFEGLRSERQLMQVVADRLSLRWYLGYDLTEPLPDHSSLTRIRDRYGLDRFRRFFETVTEQCVAAGLVGGRELYMDSTNVEANAALDSLQPRFAVEAHLADLFPTEEGAPAGSAISLIPPGDPTEPPLPLPMELSEAAQRALAERAAARHDWIGRAGRPDRQATSGSYRRTADFRVSTTDPDATPMPLGRGGTHLGYRDHYVVDGGRARIILMALVTPGEVQDNQPAVDLLWRTRFRWKIRPRQVTADTKYGTVENVVAVDAERIRFYVPLSEAGQRAGLFGDHDFRYDPTEDTYRCPGGTVLRFLSQSGATHRRIYQAPAADCTGCALRERCTSSPRGRRVSRSLDEDALDRVRGHHATEAYAKAMRKRKVWVEPLFAEAKDWHGLRRFRLRGAEKVNIQAQLIAAGQNLKRLLSTRGWGRRPWPGGATGIALPTPAPGAVAFR